MAMRVGALGICLLLASLTAAGCNPSPQVDGSANEPSREQRYVQALRDRLKKEPGRFSARISFSAWLDTGKVEDVFGAGTLAPRKLDLLLPSVADGLRTSIEVEGLAKENILDGLRKKADSLEGLNPPTAMQIRSIAVSDVLVGSVLVDGDAVSLDHLWAANTSTVRFIQPLSGELDRGQRSFEPTESLE
jgi:hypothetical protein